MERRSDSLKYARRSRQVLIVDLDAPGASGDGGVEDAGLEADLGERRVTADLRDEVLCVSAGRVR